MSDDDFFVDPTKKRSHKLVSDGSSVARSPTASHADSTTTPAPGEGRDPRC
jgi:hypothetical protein